MKKYHRRWIVACTYLKKYQLVFIFSYPILSFASLKTLRNICNPKRAKGTILIKASQLSFCKSQQTSFFLQKPTQLLLPTNEFLTDLCQQTKMHLNKLDKTVDLKKAFLFNVKCKSHLMFSTKRNVAWNIIHSSWFDKQIRIGSYIPRMPPRLAPPISHFLQISSWTRIEFQKTLKLWRSKSGTPF